MLAIENIEKSDDKRLDDFRQLKTKQSDHTRHLYSSIVIVESEAVVRQALSHSSHDSVETVGTEKPQRLSFRTLIADAEFYRDNEQLIVHAGLREDQCFSCTRDVLNEVVGFHMRRPVIASIHQPAEYSLDELRSPLLILNGLSDSENVGSIARSALALGFSSLVTDARCANPWLRRSVRVSMGALFSMHLHRSHTVSDDVRLLRDAHGFHILVAESMAQSVDIHTIQPRSPYALILGSEDQGVDKELLDLADEVVQIPMHNNWRSLNVAHAAAVAMYALQHRLHV